jgi:hypothetical protein
MALEIANTIYNQLGGGKFAYITGSKNFVGDKNSLTMHLSKNNQKAKYLKIELNADDTYTMIFSTTKKAIDPVLGFKVDQLVELRKIEMVYAEELCFQFTKVTGLFCSVNFQIK